MIFCDFYLPSYKSGGGMWTIVNLVDSFCDRYDFFVVTRNYDSKGDRQKYTSVNTDEWNRTGNAKVFYFSKNNLTHGKFAKLVNEIKPDAFFLNSAFAAPVIKFLSARRKKMFADKPVILATCGEFSAGALANKTLKKKLFLRYAKTIGLYEKVIWKASSEIEKSEIQNVIGGESEILIAPDLTPRRILPEYDFSWKPPKRENAAKFVFLSRIVRKKNIKFFLECLREINAGEIEFEILGPAEDVDYWRECESVIEKMPPNVKIKISGAFPYETALRKMSENHFFVLPTLSENFGYVCLEALAAGCPLLLSDQTVWNEIEKKNAGWEIALDQRAQWISRIEKCLAMNQNEYRKMAVAARQYSLEWLAQSDLKNATAQILERALGNSQKFAATES